MFIPVWVMILLVGFACWLLTCWKIGWPEGDFDFGTPLLHFIALLGWGFVTALAEIVWLVFFKKG